MIKSYGVTKERFMGNGFHERVVLTLTTRQSARRIISSHGDWEIEITANNKLTFYLFWPEGEDKLHLSILWKSVI